MTNRMNHAWTAGALAICSIAGTVPSVAHERGDGPRECSQGTLNGSYVLAASGFQVVGGVAQPKAIIEQVDFGGDGSAIAPNVALAVNGNPILLSTDSPASYTHEQRCVFRLAFANGPTHMVFMAPDGDSGWTLLLAPPNNVFQGTLTRVWPQKSGDKGH